MLEATMQVKVLYFGLVRERCDQRHDEQWSLPPGATVGDVVDQVVARYPAMEKYRDYVRLAVNEELAPRTAPLSDGDTVAFIPQVAGGAALGCELTREPLDPMALARAVSGPGQGGTVLFIGHVRDHNEGHDVVSLHYEAYDSMALRSLNRIVEACEARAEGVRLAIHHRVGDLEIGDAAVVIAASAPHRAEAFDAARTAIEMLKADTPIWKKEVSPAGAEWIGARP